MTLGEKKISEWKEKVLEVIDLFLEESEDTKGLSIDERLEANCGWTAPLVSNGKRYKIEITEFE